MSWSFSNGDIDPFFRSLKDEELSRWKGHYERLLKESSCKHMYEAWNRGLDMVNKVMKEREKPIERLRPVQVPLF